MTNKPPSSPAPNWDQRFSQAGFLFGTEPNAYLESQRHVFVSGKKALAVADGEGRNSVWLARQGLEVDAFDSSLVGVAKAGQLAQSAAVSVNFKVCDCDSWTWQAQAYDYVVAIFIQFAPPEMRQRLFANIQRTLKPGGYLILQGYTLKQLQYNTGGPGQPDQLYTEELLRSAFAGLEIIDLQAYEAMLDEGTQHRGPSALIGMLGRQRG
jgi:SAM-dependent methyltransferase